jgi:hypothetical protein
MVHPLPDIKEMYPEATVTVIDLSAFGPTPFPQVTVKMVEAVKSLERTLPLNTPFTSGDRVTAPTPLLIEHVIITPSPTTPPTLRVVFVPTGTLAGVA